MEKEEEYDLFEAAMNYAREKVYPKNCTINQKRIIRKKAAKLLLKDGEVFSKKGEHVSSSYLVCIV